MQPSSSQRRYVRMSSRLDFVSTHYFTDGKESMAHERCTKATTP
jgi:hypothetical protein